MANAFPVVHERLDNGMSVVVSEDRTLPVVAVNVSYDAGSGDDPMDRSGTAHLLEHLMFQGARHTGPGKHGALVSENGGTFNATTGFDRTSFFEKVPTGALELMLWLEADRMAYLVENITEERVEAQRGVVDQERRQKEHAIPFGDLFRRTLGLLFPRGHPYYDTPIGRSGDLARITAAELSDFHRRYYAATNAVLSVAGDVEPREVIRLAARHFEALGSGGRRHPRGCLAESAGLPQRDDVRGSSVGGLVQLAFRLPPEGSRSHEAAVLAINAFGSGACSRLYRRLVHQDPLAADTSADVLRLAETSIGTVRVHPLPGIETERLEARIIGELDEFTRSGPTQDEYESAAAYFESAWLRRLTTCSGRADELSRQILSTGDARRGSTLVHRAHLADFHEVRGTARCFLGDQGRRVVAYYGPEESAL